MFSIIGYLVLLSLIAWLVIGPIDRNPVSVSYSENEIILKNKVGRELNRIPVDEDNVERATNPKTKNHHNIVKLFDVNEDQINEVLLNLSNNERTIYQMFLLSSDLSDTLWLNELEMNVEYEQHPDLYFHEYLPRSIKIDDLDDDGELEIITTVEQAIHFQGHVWVLDAQTGWLEQSYKSAGWFSQVAIEDFDRDGRTDLLACGHFKGFELWGCSLLDGKNINGFAPLHERYMDANKPRALEKLLITWKGTVLGKHLYDLSENQQISNPAVYGLRTDNLNQYINLTYSEGVFGVSKSSEAIPIVKTFDFRMNPVAFSSSDGYDMIAQKLYDENILNFVINSRFLQTYKDSLYYWNGTDWIQEPTLNPRYLESVGEDSTYYLNWYFKKE